MQSTKKQEENYQFLLQLPLVRDLLTENKGLKKKVRKMEKLFIRHQLRLLEEDSNVPIFIKQEPDIYNKTKENIVYEIIEEEVVEEVEEEVEEEVVEVEEEVVEEEVEEEVEEVEEEVVEEEVVEEEVVEEEVEEVEEEVV